MESDKAVELVWQVASAVAHNVAVWHRGGTGRNSGKAQERALAAVFEALVGRKPTPEELDEMGGGTVFGGM